MVKGYAGRFLDVDLSRGAVKDVTFPESVLVNYVGGRGLAAKILWDRLGERWRDVDPLGPENLLLALTGPLTNWYPGTRVSVSGKSPQSNGIIGSTASGEFSSELRAAGYDGLVVSGESDSPVYVLVTDDRGEIRDAKHLWGKKGKETVRLINKEVRAELAGRQPGRGLWREPGILYIGPAGESKVRVAAVMQKWSHAAGYGGYGAVMGSKNLKALVAKGTGPQPAVADIDEVRRLWAEVTQVMFSNDRLRRWGTGYGGYEVGARSSSEPVRNWQEEWHDERGFGGSKFDFRYWIKRYWSDFGCPSACMKIAMVKTGPFKGAIGDNPDYELEAYEGPNLGIYDPGGCIYMSVVCDELGLSGINGGNLLAFAAELYQRGILTREDVGMDLKWGDAKAFAELAEKICRREGIGEVLAEGTYRAAKKISEMKGVDVMKYAVHVKGVEVGAHGTRSGLDVKPASYACAVQGGDHTSTVYDAYDEMTMVFADSAVICSMNAWRPGYDLVFRYYRAVTGLGTTRDEWCKVLGHRITHIQRAALLLGGPDIVWDPVKDDDNPPRFYEPLPSGPFTGKETGRATVEELKKQYYNAIGWDERGIPKPEVLKALGLDDVDRALEIVRQS